MTRPPTFSYGDVAARLATYRARLEVEGLAAKLGASQLADQVETVRRTLEAGPDGDAGPMMKIEPVRDAGGHIDVEASVLNMRLVHEVTTPELAASSSLYWRFIARRMNRGMRRRNAYLDDFARTAYEGASAAEG